MTSAFARARYGLWNHPSQAMSGTLEWRETPRSKQLVGIIPSVTLPGTVTVQRAGDQYIDVEISDAQCELIETWLKDLPSHVLPSTAQTELLIQHTGAYNCLRQEYVACELLPDKNDEIRVRVSAEVVAIGSLRKASIIITDVLFT